MLESPATADRWWRRYVAVSKEVQRQDLEGQDK